MMAHAHDCWVSPRPRDSRDDRSASKRKECPGCEGDSRTRMLGNLLSARQVEIGRRLIDHPSYPALSLGMPTVRRRRQPGEPGDYHFESLPALDSDASVGQLLELLPDDEDLILTREGRRWLCMAKVAEPLGCFRVARGHGETPAEALAECVLQVWGAL